MDQQDSSGDGDGSDYHGNEDLEEEGLEDGEDGEEEDEGLVMKISRDRNHEGGRKERGWKIYGWRLMPGMLGVGMRRMGRMLMRMMGRDGGEGEKGGEKELERAGRRGRGRKRMGRPKLWRSYSTADNVSSSGRFQSFGGILSKEPFSRGEIRECFLLWVPPKEGIQSGLRWMAESENHLFVAKRYMGVEGGEMTVRMVKEDIMLQYKAREIGQAFNSRRPPKRVEIVDCAGIMMRREGQGREELFLVEPFIAGKYEKLSNNNGWEKLERATPHALSHFSYEYSEGKLVMVDMQGVGDIYTDPGFHTMPGWWEEQAFQFHDDDDDDDDDEEQEQEQEQEKEKEEEKEAEGKEEEKEKEEKGEGKEKKKMVRARVSPSNFGERGIRIFKNTHRCHFLCEELGLGKLNKLPRLNRATTCRNLPIPREEDPFLADEFEQLALGIRGRSASVNDGAS